MNTNNIKVDSPIILSLLCNNRIFTKTLSLLSKIENDDIKIFKDTYRDFIWIEYEIYPEDVILSNSFIDDYLAKLPNRLLTKEEEQYYFRKLKSSTSKKEETIYQNIILKCNLKMVITKAKIYRFRGLDFADLIQEGNIGLLEAIDKFDYTMGNRFSTYAMEWILQKIGRSVANDGSLIRIPVHKVEKINKIRTAIYRHYKKYGTIPSDSEILCEIDNINQKDIEDYRNSEQKLLSLDYVILEFDNNMGISQSEMLSDTNEQEEEWLHKIFLKDFKNELENTGALTKKQLFALKYRYGFYDDREYDYEEIAKIMGISRQGAAGLINRGLKSLKVNEKIKNYKR